MSARVSGARRWKHWWMISWSLRCWTMMDQYGCLARLRRVRRGIFMTWTSWIDHRGRSIFGRYWKIRTYLVQRLGWKGGARKMDGMMRMPPTGGSIWASGSVMKTLLYTHLTKSGIWWKICRMLILSMLWAWIWVLWILRHSQSLRGVRRWQRHLWWRLKNTRSSLLMKLEGRSSI